MTYFIAWFTPLLSNRTGLTNVARTGIEIRRLVQSFLNARTSVIPLPKIRCPTRQTHVDSQESQDDYEMLDDLCMNDPSLLEALEREEGLLDVGEKKKREKDGRVSQVSAPLLCFFVGVLTIGTRLWIHR
jgi:hypothetical protein